MFILAHLKEVAQRSRLDLHMLEKNVDYTTEKSKIDKKRDDDIQKIWLEFKNPKTVNPWACLNRLAHCVGTNETDTLLVDLDEDEEEEEIEEEDSEEEEELENEVNLAELAQLDEDEEDEIQEDVDDKYDDDDDDENKEESGENDNNNYDNEEEIEEEENQVVANSASLNLQRDQRQLVQKKKELSKRTVNLKDVRNKNKTNSSKSNFFFTGQYYSHF